VSHVAERRAIAGALVAVVLGAPSLLAQPRPPNAARTAAIALHGCRRGLDASLVDALALELRALGVSIRASGELRVNLTCRPGTVRLVAERGLARGRQRCVQTTPAVPESDAAWERTIALLTADLVRHGQRATPSVCHWSTPGAASPDAGADPAPVVADPTLADAAVSAALPTGSPTDAATLVPPLAAADSRLHRSP
jgi:hypothetical protein